MSDFLDQGATADSNEFPLEEHKVDDEFVFVYTSGTTGNPKGVKLTNKNVCLMTEASISPDNIIG
jgi:long-subunit acyl-CoA synthetase (AMP-forming)